MGILGSIGHAALFVGALLCAPSAFALYDPAPLADIAAAQGCWTGTLTYDDYSQPGKLVTLPTRLSVAMNAPDALTLQYDFDEGKGKHVYSYENMQFDLAKGQVVWISGTSKKESSISKIVSNDLDAGMRRIVFEHPEKDGLDRYTMVLGTGAMSLLKEEVNGSVAPRFRNRYAFKRD